MSGSTNFLDQFLAQQAAPKPPAAASAESAPNFLDMYLAQPPKMVEPTPIAAPASQHPTSEATGDPMTDIPRFAGTAAVNTAAGALSLPNTLAQGVDWVGKQFGKDVGAQKAVESISTPGQPGTPLLPDYHRAREMGFNTTGGTEYVPKTWLGRRGMDAAGGALLGAAGGLRTIPAMTAGSATAGAAVEEFPEHPLAAAILGFLPGAAAGRMAGNAVVPRGGGKLPIEDARLADAAVNQYEIPLAAGQLSNNRTIGNIYSEGGRLPFSGADAFAGEQQVALNRGIARTFGETADRITPKVLLRARDRIGNDFNGIASRTTIPMDPQFMTELQDVVTRTRMTAPENIVPAVDRQAMNIVDTAANNGGDIGGRAYIMLTAKGGPIDGMLQSTDPALRQAGQHLRHVVDDALERHAAPADIDLLRQARAQWKALRTVEPLTVRADTMGGATPSTGDISAAALRGAVNKSYNRAPLANLGDVPLNDLAKIGQRFLKEPPDSGTAGRSMLHRGLGAGGSLASALAGGLAGGSMGIGAAIPAAAGLAAPLGLNRLAQALMRSPRLADRAIERSLNPDGFQFISPEMWQRLAAPAALAPATPSTRPTP